MSITANALATYRDQGTTSGAGSNVLSTGITTPSSMPMLCVAVRYKDDGTTFTGGAFTDNKSNTFTRVVGPLNFGGSDQVSFYTCQNASGGTGHTFNFNYTLGQKGAAFFPFYLTTTGSGITFDQTATGTNGFAGQPSASGTITPAAATALLACVQCNRNSAVVTTFTLTSSFTELESIKDQSSGFPDFGAYGGVVATRAVTSSAAYSTTVDDGQGAQDIANFLVSFIESSGSSVTITDIDGDESITSTQTGIVATGTGYDGTTTLAIFQGGTSKSQTVTGNTSTTLTFNAVRNAGVGTLSLYYGAATARATTGANTGDLAITLTPPDARSYVTLTSVDTTSANRLTATPDLAIGDQVEVTSVTGGSISDVTLTADGRWNALTTVISFTFQVWAASDSTIGAVGTITAIQTTGFQKTPSWVLKRHSRARVQSFDLFRKSIQPGVSDTTNRDVWLNWYGLSAQSAAAVNGTAIASGIGNASLLAAAIKQATAQASGIGTGTISASKIASANLSAIAIGTGTLQPSLVLSALAQAVSPGHGIFIGATGAVVSGSAIAAAIGYGSINSTRQLDATAIANAVGNGSATPAQIINAALIAAAEAFGITVGATGATVSGAAIAAALGMSSTASASLLAANAQATGLGTGTIISARVLNAIVTAIAESTGFVDATSGATVSGTAIAAAISSGAFAATRIINAPAVAMSAGQAALIAQQIISAQAQAQAIGAMVAPAAVVVGARAVATAESIASAIGQLYDASVTPPATRIIAIDAGGRRDITVYYRERNVTLQ